VDRRSPKKKEKEERKKKKQFEYREGGHLKPLWPPTKYIDVAQPTIFSPPPASHPRPISRSASPLQAHSRTGSPPHHPLLLEHASPYCSPDQGGAVSEPQAGWTPGRKPLSLSPWSFASPLPKPTPPLSPSIERERAAIGGSSAIGAARPPSLYRPPPARSPLSPVASEHRFARDFLAFKEDGSHPDIDPPTARSHSRGEAWGAKGAGGAMGGLGTRLGTPRQGGGGMSPGTPTSDFRTWDPRKSVHPASSLRQSREEAGMQQPGPTTTTTASSSPTGPAGQMPIAGQPLLQPPRESVQYLLSGPHGLGGTGSPPLREQPPPWQWPWRQEEGSSPPTAVVL